MLYLSIGTCWLLEFHSDVHSLNKIFNTTIISIHCKTEILLDFLYTLVLQDHTSLCLYVSVHCYNEGCTELFLRRDKDQHEDSCMWRVVQCDKCQEKVHAYELEVYI